MYLQSFFDWFVATVTSFARWFFETPISTEFADFSLGGLLIVSTLVALLVRWVFGDVD